uniref:Putative GMC oxidoreductase n=1 Tax=Phaedon cochleariae TaxID=80249 RepID=W4VSN3_PHACE
MITKLVVTVLLFALFNLEDVRCASVEELKRLIDIATLEADAYEFPRDSRIYKAKDEKIIDIGFYDFVIVGGGVAGSVIASRLSEIRQWNILVLEAGKIESSEFNQIMGYAAFLSLSDMSWGFRSVPQTTACLGFVNQSCRAFRARGMGGTSLMNGAVYERGMPSTFDEWAEITNDPSWSYENILPLFKRSEDFHLRNPNTPVEWNYHGRGGLLNVEQKIPQDYLASLFLQGHSELGSDIRDYNGRSQLGASIFQLYTKNGRRQNVYEAFLQPVEHRRPNLHIMTESYVTKIDIQRMMNEATGVIFTRHGKTYRVKTTKDVILTAGVFQTPQILMLSGIGPMEHLQEMGIHVIRDLEVGSQLKEDPLCQAIYVTTNMTKPVETLDQNLRDFLRGEGSLTQAYSTSGVAFQRSQFEEKNYADLEFIAATLDKSDFDVRYAGWKNETYQAAWGENSNAIAINVHNVNPRSSGTVRLNSADPFDHPLIDFNLMSDSEGHDMAVLYEGVRRVFDLMQTPTFQTLNPDYRGNPLPGCEQHEFLSKEYWYCFLRHTCTAANHVRGSCPMGKDPREGAIVDSRFRVFGVRRLIVADSSVMPTSMSGHPTGTILMIAEKAADTIKSQYPHSHTSEAIRSDYRIPSRVDTIKSGYRYPHHHHFNHYHHNHNTRTY